MTRLNALLLSLLLASLFGRVESWPWNFVACMACSICTLAIGLVIQSERPVVTGWSEARIDLTKLRKPAALRRGQR